MSACGRPDAGATWRTSRWRYLLRGLVERTGFGDMEILSEQSFCDALR
jgi:hypothetical protein